jgi:hypothetical protein
MIYVYGYICVVQHSNPSNVWILVRWVFNELTLDWKDNGDRKSWNLPNSFDFPLEN